MIASFASASKVFSDQNYEKIAVQCANFLWDNLYDENLIDSNTPTIENELEVSLENYQEIFVVSHDNSDNSSLSDTQEMIITRTLHYGANLVGYADSLGSLDGVFNDELFPQLTGIIGEGVAASPNPVLGLVGSLSSINNTDGYWFHCCKIIIHFTINICYERRRRGSSSCRYRQQQRTAARSAVVAFIVRF